MSEFSNAGGLRKWLQRKGIIPYEQAIVIDNP